MFGNMLRVYFIARHLMRPERVELRPGTRYLATLDLGKVRPGVSADVRDWLVKMGFAPTSDPNKWKADEKHLSRLPRESILRAEKL